MFSPPPEHDAASLNRCDSRAPRGLCGRRLVGVLRMDGNWRNLGKAEKRSHGLPTVRDGGWENGRYGGPIVTNPCTHCNLYQRATPTPCYVSWVPLACSAQMVLGRKKRWFRAICSSRFHGPKHPTRSIRKKSRCAPSRRLTLTPSVLI